MKINIVTGFFLPVPPVRGGSTEKIWHRLAVEFARAGNDVTFVSRAWPGFATRECVDGVTYLRLRGASHTRSLIWNLWRDFGWGMRVARALPPADVTICNTVTLPIWLRRFKPAAGRVVAVIARMPKGQARFYGNVDLLLSLSGAVQASLVRENPRLASRIAPFPYPIDWSRHAALPRPAGASRPLSIGFVGRIHPEKGLNLLLAAAVRLAESADLPPWQLRLVGPAAISDGGGGEDYRRSLVSEFGPRLGDQLTFCEPEFDPDRLAVRYSEIDVFCYPSVAETGETFGLAIAEAMAAGAVPVVSNLECFRDLVLPEATGLVFDHRAPAAVEDLAKCLATLLQDSARRAALAQSARAHVRRFDFQPVAAALLSTLEQRCGSLQPPNR